MAPISILVVDDSEMIRKALRRLLSGAPERWVICDEAFDGTEALAKAAWHRPHVALLDLSLPGMSGLDVAKEMAIKFPDLVIVPMSQQEPSVLRRLADDFELRYTLPKSQLGAQLIPVLAEIEKELRRI